MTVKRRDLFKTAGSLAAVSFAAAPLARPRIARAAGSSVLKFAPQADLVILDPIWTTATVTRNHAFAVFDTLFGQDASYQPQPQMAEGAVASDDGKTWTIKLRDGLMFHDGSKVLARDCVASVQRWGKKDAFGQALMAATDEISARDDSTIVFRMKRPFPLLAHALSKFTAYVPVMMPERLAMTDPGKQVQEMVGSGPFTFNAKERLAGARVVYDKFKGYQPRNEPASLTAGGKVAHFERIEWQVIPDAATAGAALQNGEIDWWESPSNDYLPLLRKQKGITIARIRVDGNIAIARMNHLQPPFDNPAIRRVVVEAVRQKDYMTAVAGTDPSMSAIGVGVFTPGTPMASTDGMAVLAGTTPWDKVQRDLKAAGYNGEKMVMLSISDFPELTALSQVGADMFRKMGMNLDEQVMDWGSVVSRRPNKGPPDQGGWNVFFTSWAGTDMFNPAGHLSLRGNGDGAWFGWPSIPKIEELRDAWFTAPTLAEQQKLCAQIQLEVLKEVPYVPLGQYFQNSAYRADISGVLTGMPLFYNARRV